MRADGSPDDGWAIRSVRTGFANPYLTVTIETIGSPSRPDGVTWTVARRKAAVVMAPRLPDGSYLLIRQERYPIARAIWEFPAGQIDGVGGIPDDVHILDAAHRELREECGHTVPPAGRLIPLGSFFTSPGFTDEHCHLFLADGVVPDVRGPEHDEHEAILAWRAVPPGELIGMARDGLIDNANTLCALARLIAHGHLSVAAP